ncbi:MAG: thioredoxin-dependent thiol peroxidase [Bacteroidota bacterium]|nr:thioredoxin-dependent thiol peroxidase [Bacteroidota bacterium]
MITLKEGDKAPAFAAKDQNDRDISLNMFRGKKVALYFYPKDDTPGCTAQACNLRDNYSALLQQGYVVIGVSADDVNSHKKFESKFKLPFPLVADDKQVISQEYGVWGEKQMFGKKFMGITRTTFLIDEEGKIKKVINKPDTEHHAEQVMEAWEKL